MTEKRATRRGFLSVAVTAIVVGVVAGVGGYYAGLMGVPSATVTSTSTTTRPTTLTTTRTTTVGPGEVVTTTATVTAPPVTRTATVTETVRETVTETTTTGPPPPAKDEITIGFPLSLSGPYAAGSELQHKNNWYLWHDFITAAGGIYVKEYGKRLPVRLIEYDDKSDVDTMTRILEKLATEDKVDFMLPPHSTGPNFAVHPVFNKYEYPHFAPTCMSLKMAEENWPWFYSMSPRIDKIMGNLAGLVQDINRTTPLNKIALIYVGDLFGVEGSTSLEPLLKAAGLNIEILESYPLVVTDLSPLIKEMKSAEIDCMLAISYPTDSFLLVKQCRELAFNPKVWYGMVGIHFGHFPMIAGGVDVAHGVMGPAKWNLELGDKLGGKNPTIKEYRDGYIAKWGIPPDQWDMGGFCMLQILAQAIEEAGTLNRREIKRVLDSGHMFETTLGPCNYETWGGIHQWSYTGENGPGNSIAQWQKASADEAIFEILWPKQYATGDPIVPKPPWP